MGLSNSLLSSIITESLGKEHLTVIETLSKPKHDEEIAVELNLKPTVVRTLLNDLHAKNLVGYERSKNKKTGWYTYLWKRRQDKIDAFLKAYLDEALDARMKELDMEREGVTFHCSCDNGRVSLEDAMETNFVCPGCSGRYVESDNKKIIKELESDIKKLKKLRNK